MSDAVDYRANRLSMVLEILIREAESIDFDLPSDDPPATQWAEAVTAQLRQAHESANTLFQILVDPAPEGGWPSPEAR